MLSCRVLLAAVYEIDISRTYKVARNDGGAHFDSRFLSFDRSDLSVGELELFQLFLNFDRLRGWCSTIFSFHLFVVFSIASTPFGTVFLVRIVGIILRIRSVPFSSFTTISKQVRSAHDGSKRERGGGKDESSHDTLFETVVTIEFRQIESEEIV